MKSAALLLLTLVCCTSTADRERAACTALCRDHDGLTNMDYSDDFVQLLCYCNDGSVQIHVKNPPETMP